MHHKERKVLQKENNLTMEEKKLFLSAPVLAYPPDRQGGIPQPYSILTDPQSISSVAIRSHYL